MPVDLVPSSSAAAAAAGRPVGAVRSSAASGPLRADHGGVRRESDAVVQ